MSFLLKGSKCPDVPLTPRLCKRTFFFPVEYFLQNSCRDEKKLSVRLGTLPNIFCLGSYSVQLLPVRYYIVVLDYNAKVQRFFSPSFLIGPLYICYQRATRATKPSRADRQTERRIEGEEKAEVLWTDSPEDFTSQQFLIY
jgi:hypothetical protein